MSHRKRRNARPSRRRRFASGKVIRIFTEMPEKKHPPPLILTDTPPQRARRGARMFQAPRIRWIPCPKCPRRFEVVDELLWMRQIASDHIFRCTKGGDEG